MTDGGVRTWSAFASRAMNPGASASPAGKTFWLTTTTVSIVWPESGAVGPTDSKAASRPTDRLLDRVKALVQRVRHVARGVVPRREVEGGVYAPGDLAHPARDQRERAAHRIRPERAAEAGDGREGGNPGRRRADLVGDPRPQRAHVPEVEPQREGILVARAGRGVEVVADERHVAAARRVDADPHEGEGRVGRRHDPPVPLPATVALEARGVAGAGGLVASEKAEHRKEGNRRGQCRRVKTYRASVRLVRAQDIWPLMLCHGATRSRREATRTPSGQRGCSRSREPGTPVPRTGGGRARAPPRRRRP